jgi:MscS family membrane protein
MVIAESVKILRLIALVLLALILFSPAWGSNDLLKFSVLCVIGLAIALGFVPAFHNVIGGLFLAFNAQFKVDDFIEVGNAKGFVHRVALRYTTIITMNGTKVFVPNSFFLYKPMVNFTQRPKQEIDLTVSVATTTPVDKLRMCIERIEQMLKSLHLGLTSHEENNNDSRQGEKWERFFFVAMEELFKIHVFSYTDELDPRKHAMIKSEVWLAVMEIMEELKIEVINKPPKSQQDLIHHEEDDDTPSPFSAEMNLIIGNSNNKRYH